MDRWTGNVAVITGASSGIGLATAKALVKQGLIVVGLARRRSKMEDEMKDFKGDGQFYALQCDITNEEQVRDAFSWIKKHLKTIHILINNAGTMMPGCIADLEFKKIKEVIDINFTGLLLCSKLAIDLMKEGGHESHIIMINSTAGLRMNPVPSEHNTNVYSVTKYAVKALSQVLERELYGGNIRITSISPGAVKTELFDNLCEQFTVMKGLDYLESEDIADAVIYVIGTPSRVQIEELTIKPRRAPY